MQTDKMDEFYGLSPYDEIPRQPLQHQEGINIELANIQTIQTVASKKDVIGLLRQRFKGCCHPTGENKKNGFRLTKKELMKEAQRMVGIIIYDSHDTRKPVGKVLTAYVDEEEKLMISGGFFDNEFGREAHNNLVSKKYSGLSLGCRHLFDQNTQSVIESSVEEVSVCEKGQLPQTEIFTYASRQSPAVDGASHSAEMMTNNQGLSSHSSLINHHHHHHHQETPLSSSLIRYVPKHDEGLAFSRRSGHSSLIKSFHDDDDDDDDNDNDEEAGLNSMLENVSLKEDQVFQDGPQAKGLERIWPYAFLKGLFFAKKEFNHKEAVCMTDFQTQQQQASIASDRLGKDEDDEDEDGDVDQSLNKKEKDKKQNKWLDPGMDDLNDRSSDFSSKEEEEEEDEPDMLIIPRKRTCCCIKCFRKTRQCLMKSLCCIKDVVCFPFLKDDSLGSTCVCVCRRIVLILFLHLSILAFLLIVIGLVGVIVNDGFSIQF